MGLRDEILRLARGLADDELTLKPTRTEEVDAFAMRNGLNVPPELREWFLTINGLGVGTAGPFGIRPDVHALDVDYYYRLVPQWRSMGWVPIAQDGSGDYYVIDTGAVAGTTCPVYFIDHENGVPWYGTANYVVASGVWPFVFFFLFSEQEWRQGEEFMDWPWEREWVLSRDPDLASYAGDVAFPWDLPG